MITYNVVLNDLDKGIIKPVYVFSGKEEFLERELEQKIKTISTDTSSKSFDYEILDGRQCDVGSLIIKCRTIPFFSSKRLIVVKDADVLCASDELIIYTKNPVQTTCLILMIKKSITALKEYEVRFNKLRFQEKAEWIRKKVKRFKKEITSDAIQVLEELTGENLGRLCSEIEKLVLFVGEKTLISKEDVQNLYPNANQLTNIFEFVDAIGGKNKKQALRILRDLILTEDTGRILVMISRQFRLILQSKELTRKGYSPEKICREIEISQNWILRKITEQARNFSSNSLVDKFKILANAELDIKTGKIRPPSFGLEILVSKLCR